MDGFSVRSSALVSGPDQVRGFPLPLLLRTRHSWVTSGGLIVAWAACALTGLGMFRADCAGGGELGSMIPGRLIGSRHARWDHYSSLLGIFAIGGRS